VRLRLEHEKGEFDMALDSSSALLDNICGRGHAELRGYGEVTKVVAWRGVLEFKRRTVGMSRA
jgi:hypothetical protein